MGTYFTSSTSLDMILKDTVASKKPAFLSHVCFLEQRCFLVTVKHFWQKTMYLL